MGLNMFEHLTAERTSRLKVNNNYFYQHQKVYSFALKLIKNKNILDIGSGGGYGTYRLSLNSKEAYGLDRDYSAICRSKSQYRRRNLHFIHSSIESYKTKKTFDYITCFQFIEHIKDQASVIVKMKKLLTTHGALIISTPNASTQSFNENPYHHKELTLQEFTSLLLKDFKKVELYGLFGDKKIKKIDINRKKAVKNLFKLDPFSWRRFIPRSTRKVMFDLASFFMIRLIIAKKKGTTFSEKNFTIKKATNRSMDFIAVCRK